MEATITLEYDDEKTAEAVAEAVSPDNYKIPVDLTVTTVTKQKTVVTEIKTEGKMSTFIATIDDLLCSITVAEKTVKTVRED